MEPPRSTSPPVAELEKDVSLGVEVTSKPLTPPEVQEALNQPDAASLRFSPYTGLGVTACYFSFDEDATYDEGITAIVGTRRYGASVDSETLSASKLAALAKHASEI